MSKRGPKLAHASGEFTVRGDLLLPLPWPSSLARERASSSSLLLSKFRLRHPGAD